MFVLWDPGSISRKILPHIINMPKYYELILYTFSIQPIYILYSGSIRSLYVLYSTSIGAPLILYSFSIVGKV